MMSLAQEDDEFVRAYQEANSLPASTILFNRTMTILTGMVALAYGGSMLSWSWEMTLGFALMTFVGSLVMIFVAAAMAHTASDDDISPLFPIAAFAFLEGMSVGPVLAHYTEILGPQEVNLALAITAGATATFGGIGYVVTIAYRKIESFLMIGLLGLIGFYVVSMFMAVPEEVNVGMSALGGLLFCGFLVVDFARLKAESAAGVKGWGAAGMIAMNIFLDILNLLLIILRLMAAASSDDD